MSYHRIRRIHGEPSDLTLVVGLERPGVELSSRKKNEADEGRRISLEMLDNRGMRSLRKVLSHLERWS